MPTLDEILKHYEGRDNLQTLGNLDQARHNGDDIEKWGQENLAPAEHFAFNRLLMERNPELYGAAFFAPPLYAARKLMYRRPGETPASMDQVVGAWKGGFRGLLDALLGEEPPRANTNTTSRGIWSGLNGD